MRKLAYGLLALACTAVLAASAALALGTRSAEGGGDHHGPPVSKDVRHMLRDISATNIEHSITTLASFGTRHTLSSQTDPNRGIGAATNWIFDQFSQYAAASNGRLTVERQTFIQPPGPRNPNPVPVTNVIATLRGSQSPDRIYLVSGHIDSRCTDVLDFTCDAPGADDDASGVAAVLELARVMSKHSFDATIVFATFAGEEQGTFGSIHYAQGPRLPARTSPGCSPTTSSGQAWARTAFATAATCACSPRARGRTKPRRRQRPDGRWAARTTRPRASWPASCARRRRQPCRR
jgi:peptidase M28-like protein